MPIPPPGIGSSRSRGLCNDNKTQRGLNGASVIGGLKGTQNLLVLICGREEGYRIPIEHIPLFRTKNQKEPGSGDKQLLGSSSQTS